MTIEIAEFDPVRRLCTSSRSAFASERPRVVEALFESAGHGRAVALTCES